MQVDFVTRGLMAHASHMKRNKSPACSRARIGKIAKAFIYKPLVSWVFLLGQFISSICARLDFHGCAAKEQTLGLQKATLHVFDPIAIKVREPSVALQGISA
jgi:hypothetical protein